MSIKIKILLSLTSVFAVVFATYSFFTTRQQIFFMNDQYFNEMQNKTEILAKILESKIGVEEKAVDQSDLSELLELIGAESLVILDGNGMAVMDTRSTEREHSGLFKTLKLTENIHRTIKSLDHGGPEKYRVILHFSKNDLMEEKRILMEQRILYAFLFLLACILISEILIRKIMFPLKGICRDIEEVADGNLIWKKSFFSENEYGRISESMEHIVTNLKKYMNPLAHNDRLANLGEIALGVVHEIRSPLEPIKGSAELIQRRYGNDETVAKYTGIIKDEVVYLSGFLENFLEFARPRELTFRKVNISMLVDETLAFMERYLEENKMRVSKKYIDHTLEVWIDPQQMKQVFMNLFHNALQAMKKKSGLLEITIRNDAETATVEFFDYGRGIQRESLKTVFEPFVTMREKGTGLGLAICRNIISLHNGTIEIDSHYGQWTLVRISLPRNNPEKGQHT